MDATGRVMWYHPSSFLIADIEHPNVLVSTCLGSIIKRLDLFWYNVGFFIGLSYTLPSPGVHRHHSAQY